MPDWVQLLLVMLAGFVFLVIVADGGDSDEMGQ